jgi:hypothetical protein
MHVSRQTGCSLVNRTVRKRTPVVILSEPGPPPSVFRLVGWEAKDLLFVFLSRKKGQQQILRFAQDDSAFRR